MKVLRALFLIGLALPLAATLAGCQSGPTEEETESSVLADHEIDGFELTQTRDGARLWKLRAQRALIFEDADRVEMEKIRIDYFNEDGETRSTLTALHGLLRRRTNDMEARGDVVVTADDGTILTTQKLTWNERTGKIESDKFVRVTKGSDVFTGVGVEADPDLRNMRVKSEFKAYVRTPEGELVEED
jgi:LPS export ABC transporter protein LptC